MNILRRVQIGAGVVVASAAIGALSGVLVASTLLFTRLGHFRPQLIAEVIKVGSQTGASFGIIVGVPITLALLRRVPLTRIATDTFAATTYGGIVGFALSLAFAQPRPTIGFMVVGSCVGAAVAAMRLWSQFRDARRATVLPSAG